MSQGQLQVEHRECEGVEPQLKQGLHQCVQIVQCQNLWGTQVRHHSSNITGTTEKLAYRLGNARLVETTSILISFQVLQHLQDSRNTLVVSTLGSQDHPQTASCMYMHVPARRAGNLPSPEASLVARNSV